MKLLEYQGKELFERYGIQVPRAQVLSENSRLLSLAAPLVLKAQVPSGNRLAKGGVVFVEKAEELEEATDKLLKTAIDGVVPATILAEERIVSVQELYASFSYDSQTRGPVLALSQDGGSGIEDMFQQASGTLHIYPVDLLLGMQDFVLRNALLQSGIALDPVLLQTIKSLWDLFVKEQAILAEINPLMKTKDGAYIAGDAKIILDDNIVDPSSRPYLDLDGDIGVLASGGGASLVNLDALMHFRGKPANYVEYSGNPPAEVVDELTQRVFAKPGLKGAWVVGGTANFTDIYETMKGFVEGLRKVQPKPTYPIVIRRDGPRQKEAFEMLREVAEKEGYDFHLYGPEISMSESARKIVELAYERR